MLEMPPHISGPMIAIVLERWYELMRAGVGRSERRRVRPDGIKGVAEGPDAGFAIPPYDVSLLFRRITMLRIDRDELARDDPLLFCELQGRCTLCQSRGHCARDLAHEFDDPAWQDWRDYCPNSTTLSFLGTLQDCSSATQP
jgi:hypothetical protein